MITIMKRVYLGPPGFARKWLIVECVIDSRTSNRQDIGEEKIIIEGRHLRPQCIT
jgi:hypothetical protein